LSEVKTIGRLGRIVIPATWRRKWGKRVVLHKVNDEVLVRTLRKRGKLTDLIDSIEVDVDDFTDTHKLREKLYG